ARRPLQRRQGDRSIGDQYIRPQLNQFCRGGTETVRSNSEAIIDPDVTTLYPSELLHSLVYHCSTSCKILTWQKSPNPPHPVGLLRPRRQRPRRRRGAEKGEEGAAVHQCPHHSITSSAMANTVGGISRPMALAVLRLMTSGNLVGYWTGRSLGFAPRR